MKKIVTSILTYVVPLSLGIFLIWYIYRGLGGEEKQHLWNSFKGANLTPLIFSLCLGILSHASRAYRWKYMLEPLGFKPRFLNSFFSVMIGYLANFAFPRLGEVTRCAVMSKYEKVPVEKLLGTVIAERVADMVLLLTITITVILSQFAVLSSFFAELSRPMIEKINMKNIGIAITFISFFVILIVIILKKSKHSPWLMKIRSMITGFGDGLRTIITMKHKWFFIAHTLFIWLMYFCMTYICFFSLEETSSAGVGCVLAAFVSGGFAVIVVQGGIGAFPAIIMQMLVIYGIPKVYGFALGWIIWLAQTAMLLTLGFISIAIMPGYNKLRMKNDELLKRDLK